MLLPKSEGCNPGWSRGGHEYFFLFDEMLENAKLVIFLKEIYISIKISLYLSNFHHMSANFLERKTSIFKSFMNRRVEFLKFFVFSIVF